MGWKIIIAICFKLYITILDAIHTNDVWIETVGGLKRILKAHLLAVFKVSGEANETQIAEALKRYSERAFFVREALFHLFSLTHVMEKTKPEILKVRTRNWI